MKDNLRGFNTKYVNLFPLNTFVLNFFFSFFFFFQRSSFKIKVQFCLC